MFPNPRSIRCALAAALLSLGLASAARATLTIVQGDYKLPAAVDATVTASLETELWARVYRPESGGPHPLVVFLHGNHGTCGRFDPRDGVRYDDRSDYTFSGTCPAGYVVSPNHLGYEYLARSLARNGFVVVSINANRGVNAAPGEAGDDGLNLRRGRLVLRHLQKLARWNAGVAAAPASLGFPLLNAIDFAHVGLMGHSRGGEGMRAAVDQFREAASPWPARIGAVTFEGLFEIGPVDGQTSRVLDAAGLAWAVLLPGCDGDVSDLQGVRPFDRALAITTEPAKPPKASFLVYGANHNFYNTQWQQSDATGCQGQTAIFPQAGSGSAAQRRTASKTLVPFMLAHVGPNRDAAQARRFDPSYPLPSALTAITGYARGYSPTPRGSQNFVIDSFNRNTGTSSANVANESAGLSAYSHGPASASHSPAQRAAAISVDAAGAGVFLQTNASAPGVPLDVAAYAALEFRVALQCDGSLCAFPPSAGGDADFTLALAQSDGTLSRPVTLRSVAVVRRPAAAEGVSGANNVLMQTVRVPLASFGGADLSRFRGVRFTFDLLGTQSLLLADVRLTRQNAGPGALMPELLDEAAGPAGSAVRAQAAQAAQAAPAEKAAKDSNRIVGIRRIATSRAIDSAEPAVEIELASSRPFPIGGALPVIAVGADKFALSRFPAGPTDRLIFTLTGPQFDALPQGAPVTVRIGGAEPWAFGALPK